MRLGRLWDPNLLAPVVDAFLPSTVPWLLAPERHRGDAHWAALACIREATWAASSVHPRAVGPSATRL